MCRLCESAGEVRRAAEALAVACYDRIGIHSIELARTDKPLGRQLGHAFRTMISLPHDFSALVRKIDP